VRELRVSGVRLDGLIEWVGWVWSAPRVGLGLGWGEGL
jgi:hypothetical protein